MMMKKKINNNVSGIQDNILGIGRILNKKFGKGSIRSLIDESVVKVPSISTGCYGLNNILGINGLPLGRIVEVYGDEQTGKTTLLYHTIKSAQKRNFLVAFIDAEHSCDPIYAKDIGIDLGNMIFSQPDSMEEVLDIVEGIMVEKDIELPAVICLDSIASLSPLVELEGDMGNMTIGLQARKMSQWLRRIKGIVRKTNTLLLCTNQTRTKVGVRWGNPEFTPGGKALKFYASIRIEFKKIKTLKKGKVKLVGNRIRARVVKSRLSVPFKTTDFNIIWGKGIDNRLSILETALGKRVIDRSGNTYTFRDVSAIGLERFKEKLGIKDYKKVMKEMGRIGK